MEVTRENFLEVFPEIECAVKDADFIAIDGEFSGLGTDLPAKVVYDTPGQRYKRLRQGLSNYIIIQYGICTFKWSHELLRYEAKPFNVYIFPRAPRDNDVTVKFLCQSSSIEFLTKQGFDFNKLFYKGLSFVRADKEATLRQNMLRWRSSSSNGAKTPNDNDAKTPKSTRAVQDNAQPATPKFIPEIMKSFVDDICEKLTRFVEDSEETVLELPATTSFRRKLTYDVIEERFPSNLHIETAATQKGEEYIKVIKGNEETLKKLREECDAKKMAEFETTIGFLKIAKLLSESNKLIVGHNMLLDLMLTIGQFFTILPETLDEFKELVQTVFPKLVDTKLLSTTQPLKDKLGSSRLADLFACLRDNFKEPGISLAEEFESYDDSPDKLHEAGYDAYCTGVCFAKMASHLCSLQYPGDVFQPIDLDAQMLQPFINRVFVMRINELTYINMAGADDAPDRKNVFHLTYPSTWKYNEINHLFNNYAPVYISLLNETSALVSVSREDLIHTVLDDLELNKKENSPYKLVSYAEYAGLESKEKCCKHDKVSKKQSLKRKMPNDEDDECSTSLQTPKKIRAKRASNDSLEEGELSDSSKASSSEEDDEKSADVSHKGTEKLTQTKKTRATPKTPAKDFDEPDEW
eukprot:gene8987-9947_t